MRVVPRQPPREFEVLSVRIRHVADVELEPDEQVTFVTASGSEFDVVRKSWGYYATPSLNERLPAHGLRPALVRGRRSGKMYVLLAEPAREREFLDYVEADRLEIVSWLDERGTTDELVRRLRAAD